MPIFFCGGHKNSYWLQHRSSFKSIYLNKNHSLWHIWKSNTNDLIFGKCPSVRSNLSFLRLEVLKILMLLSKGFCFFELKIYVRLTLSSFNLVTWSSWTTFLLSLSKLITEEIAADRRPSLLSCLHSSKSLQLMNIGSENSDRKALANVNQFPQVRVVRKRVKFL